MANELTGIERQLVLQYLIDGNAPITVTRADTPVGAKTDASHIFPVAVRAEQMTVLDQGIMLLKNHTETMQSFDGKQVRVQFYFNNIGLYFITQMKKVSAGFAIVIPSSIQRVVERVEQKPRPFSAMLYYAVAQDGGDLHLDCQFDDAYTLFVPMDWNNAIVHFLATKGEDTTVQKTVAPPTVLYIDQTRIIFGTEKRAITFVQGAEYALRLGFPLPKPLKEREVYVTCTPEKIIASEHGEKSCAVCRYTSIKEEDVRYLSDLMKKKD